jgi:hypothetical protein
MDDTTCEFGVALCLERLCQPCPPPEVCGDCPEGWVHLTRNGCETCQCGPRPECDLPGELCDPGSGVDDVCYDGATCAECWDPWQPGCCSNTCSMAGCASPAPVGCFTACPPELNCPSCATGTCECDGQQWRCDAVCAETPFVCSFP